MVFDFYFCCCWISVVFDFKWYKLKSHGSEHWFGLSDLMECKLEENVKWEEANWRIPSLVN